MAIVFIFCIQKPWGMQTFYTQLYNNNNNNSLLLHIEMQQLDFRPLYSKMWPLILSFELNWSKLTTGYLKSLHT